MKITRTLSTLLAINVLSIGIATAQNLRQVHHEQHRQLGLWDTVLGWFGKSTLECPDKEAINCDFFGRPGIVACVSPDFDGVSIGELFPDESMNWSLCVPPDLITDVDQCGYCDPGDVPKTCNKDDCEEGKVKIQYVRDIPSTPNGIYCVDPEKALSAQLTGLYKCFEE